MVYKCFLILPSVNASLQGGAGFLLLIFNRTLSITVYSTPFIRAENPTSTGRKALLTSFIAT